jgi:hypothetical protein
MGFHPEGVGTGHTPDGNREAKRRHVANGTVHQTLVYTGDDCVGWSQYGSPSELPNIKNRAACQKGLQTPPDWRIGCIFTRPGLLADCGVALIVARTLCRWCDGPPRSARLPTPLSEPERGHTQLACWRYR